MAHDEQRSSLTRDRDRQVRRWWCMENSFSISWKTFFQVFATALLLCRCCCASINFEFLIIAHFHTIIVCVPMFVHSSCALLLPSDRRKVEENGFKLKNKIECIVKKPKRWKAKFFSFFLDSRAHGTHTRCWFWFYIIFLFVAKIEM